MTSAQLKSLLLISTVSLFGYSCASVSRDANYSALNSNANAVGNSAKKAKDNAEELGMLIKLPAEPDDVVWRDEMVPVADKNQTERRVTAILFYEDRAVIEKVFADAAMHGEPQPVSIDVADWFPQELKAQSEFSEDAKLSGKVYPANDFFQEPLLRGRLIRVDGSEHIILELFAK